MATATATATATTTTPPTSPLRKTFAYISPARAKAVVSIMTPKRRTSQASLASQGTTPPQRRAVSTPARSALASAEPAPSVSSVTTARSLTFPHVADIFIKLRRVQNKVKAHHIISTSGPVPVTHPSLVSETAPTPAITIAGPSNEPAVGLSGTDAADTPKRRARMELQDEFVCADAVDAAKLLRASRASLLERTDIFHANVLVEEEWSCSVCSPKHRNDGSYRVHIRYAATAARSSRRDPRQPVALSEAKGTPGLMTIVSREIVALTVELFQES